MKMALDKKRLDALRSRLEADEDAQLEGESYVLDLYDAEPPVSMELRLTNDGAEVLAALSLLYDEELDGWYPGEKIKDAAVLAALLNAYIAG